MLVQGKHVRWPLLRYRLGLASPPFSLREKELGALPSVAPTYRPAPAELRSSEAGASATSPTEVVLYHRSHGHHPSAFSH